MIEIDTQSRDKLIEEMPNLKFNNKLKGIARMLRNKSVLLISITWLERPWNTLSTIQDSNQELHEFPV